MKSKITIWIYAIAMTGLLIYHQILIYSRGEYYSRFDYFDSLFISFIVIVIATLISIIFQILQNIKNKAKPWASLLLIIFYGIAAFITYAVLDQIVSLIF